jgi:hypothetical protein
VLFFGVFLWPLSKMLLDNAAEASNNKEDAANGGARVCNK